MAFQVHPTHAAFNFNAWLEQHRDQLKPPVANKLLHASDDMIVMVVGGPNTRMDFHDDPVQEWFYQLEGDMVLKIADNGDIYDVPIREGEVFLLPAHLRHAPQRPQAGSVGIVVEAPREADMIDGFEWFCFECKRRVHRAEVSLVEPSMIVTELPKIFDAFHDDLSARRCDHCGAVHPGKGQAPDGWVEI
ncbi:MAG: 3-hydroxyanthranilate 3,4-dioxygenase [Pseudomonadota bacterium]